MGVEYDLNDPAKGESFDFGKGWHGSELEGSTDYDRAPLTSGPGHCQYHAHRGPPYRWTPLKSRDEVLEYVTTHFWFLEVRDHSHECRHAAQRDMATGEIVCEKWCQFQEGDPEYAGELADKLWAWLEGRDQSQLDVTDDCSGDDIHCKKNDADHEKWCVPVLADGRGWPKPRHFYVTGSRYSEDWAPRKKTA